MAVAADDRPVAKGRWSAAWATAVHHPFPGFDAVRAAVNHWIRTSGEYDAVVDFDRALADPADPDAMLPAYDSGDALHPNDAGMTAMADAINLADL